MIWTTAGETFVTTFSRDVSSSRNKLDRVYALDLTVSAPAGRESVVDCAFEYAATSKQAIVHFRQCNLVMMWTNLAQTTYLRFFLDAQESAVGGASCTDDCSFMFFQQLKFHWTAHLSSATR